MPHREFEMYDAWLAMQWNKPDRNDHYLMKFMSVVVGLFVKKGTVVDPNEFRVKFEQARKDGEAKPEMSPEEKKRISQAGIARLLKGSKVKATHKVKPKNT